MSTYPPTSNTHNVYIGNLHPGITEQELKDSFNDAGAIAYVKIIKDRNTGLCKGYGFIYFENYEGQQKALQIPFSALSIKGQVCHTKPAVQKSNNYNNNPSRYNNNSNAPSKVLFVGNLDPKTTEETLNKTFSPYGQIIRATIKQDPQTGISRGFGFVEFQDISSCDSYLQEQPVTTIDGSSVRIERAKPQQPRRPHYPRTARHHNAPMYGNPPPNNYYYPPAAANPYPAWQQTGWQPQPHQMHGAGSAPAAPQYSYYNNAPPAASYNNAPPAAAYNNAPPAAAYNNAPPAAAYNNAPPAAAPQTWMGSHTNASNQPLPRGGPARRRHGKTQKASSAYHPYY